MRVAWGVYSPGEGIIISECYLCKNIYHLHYSDCAISQCSSGRRIWDWYFSPTSSAVKQLPASPCTALSLFPFTPPSSRECQFTRTDLNVTPGNKVNGMECMRHVFVFGGWHNVYTAYRCHWHGQLRSRNTVNCVIALRLDFRRVGLLFASICKGQTERPAVTQKLPRDCWPK